jgi:hypothetical protein
MGRSADAWKRRNEWFQDKLAQKAAWRRVAIQQREALSRHNGLECPSNLEMVSEAIDALVSASSRVRGDVRLVSASCPPRVRWADEEQEDETASCRPRVRLVSSPLASCPLASAPPVEEPVGDLAAQNRSLSLEIVALKQLIYHNDLWYYYTYLPLLAQQRPAGSAASSSVQQRPAAERRGSRGRPSSEKFRQRVRGRDD